MSYAELGDYCVVGANTFVAYHKKFTEKSLIAGVPGKLIRQLEGDMLQASQVAVDIYLDLVKQYTSGRIAGHTVKGGGHD
jgi:carbonic anhydrase/acetyltransferase-like protein (isoleucine patch superfamily)